MTKEELLEELIIRFNTSPKLYEKKDYKVLLKLLEAIIDNFETKVDVVDGASLMTDKEREVLSNKVDKEDGKQLISEEDLYRLYHLEDLREIMTEGLYEALRLKGLVNPDIVYYTYESEDDEKLPWLFGSTFPINFVAPSEWRFGNTFPINF